MKTISSQISLLSLATLLGLPFAAQARFSVTPIPLTAATDANLQNNTIYEVNDNLTLPAVAGSSKFRVLGNNVVAINIKKDVTLTLKGGDATGETGAGAAISVALSRIGAAALIQNLCSELRMPPSSETRLISSR